MAVSQNGWPASPGMALTPISAGGVRLLVAPPAAPILGHVLTRFHNTVEPVRGGECWGYSYRIIRDGVAYSNHASGTAIDVNAPSHPLGARGTFTASQTQAIRVLLAECGGLVRWGGDYVNRADEMHFEVAGTAAQVAAWRPPSTIDAGGDDDVLTSDQAWKLDQIHTLLADAWWVDRSVPPFAAHGQLKTQTDRIEAKVDAVAARPQTEVDAAAVAAALAADPAFLAGVAKAVNDDAAERLAG